MLSEFQHAFRRLLKAPGFSLIAILTLALGLAANITIFGMISEFMLRPLQVPQPHELAFVMQKNPKVEIPFAFSYPDYLDFRTSLSSEGPATGESGRVYSGLLAESVVSVHLSEAGQNPRQAWVAAVSENYFDVLGVKPARGRFLLPGEGVAAGADPIVVLGHACWEQQFNSDPHIVGRSITLNGVSFTIVGVAPERFGGTQAMVQAQMFAPATMWETLQPGDQGGLERRGNTTFLVMGRIVPGSSTEQARAATEAVLARLIADHPNEHAPTTVIIVPERMSRPSPHVSSFTPLALAALMVLALLVLAVAAANIANLFYTRAAQAERTLAIRSSLGASRWRLVRHLLAESVLLALAASVLGWLASDVFGQLISGIALSADNPPVPEPTEDWVQVAFTLGAALATGLVTGIFPALRATRRDMLSLLNDATRSVSGGRHPLRRLLVCGQVALSCVVLVCAGLAAHSLHKLGSVDLGFRPDNVLMASFDLKLQRYDLPRAQQFQKTLLDEVRAMPGVKAASLSRSAPFDRSIGLRGGISAEGQPPPDRNEVFLVAVAPASDGWLSTLGMPLLAGRDLSEHDRADTQQVAIVNEALARHFWPGEDPIGKRMVFSGNRLVEVVGLVGRARYFMMSDTDRPFLFRPLGQEPRIDFTLAIRTERDPRLLAQPLLQLVQRLDPNLPVQNLRTLEEQIAQSPLGLMPLRLGAIIATTQGALVLVLAVMGLYGLVSFAVTCRTREIGIRMALGATRRDILRLITRPSALLTGTGLLIGLALAYVVTSPLAGLLYGVTPDDLVVFLGVPSLIIAVTVLATWLPARRAVRINPTEALRAE